MARSGIPRLAFLPAAAAADLPAQYRRLIESAPAELRFDPVVV
jgi:hypothetical protein